VLKTAAAATFMGDGLPPRLENRHTGQGILYLHMDFQMQVAAIARSSARDSLARS
jgi:hypothetical protein